MLDAVERFGNAQRETIGTRLIYPADEWYIKAGRPIPDEAFYEEMSQLENGVGMSALMRAQFTEALEHCEATSAGGTDTVLVTGVAAEPLICELTALAKEHYPVLRARVQAIRNEFFGETITVAGLVTGCDLKSQLRDVACERVLVPDVMLRHERDRFLDDVTPEELAEALGVRVQIVAADGESLLEALLQ